MQDVYGKCPIIENDRFLLRLIAEDDAHDLFKVYSDKKALPFFNSDNCHGDNFYMTEEKNVLEVIRYWLLEYENKGFVRFSIVDKTKNTVVGTIELFNRKADDYFNDCGLLRLDLHFDYENSGDIADILSLITEPAFELFHCSMIATKAPVYAVDRIAALKETGFVLSNECLLGTYDQKAYYGYWVKEKNS